MNREAVLDRRRAREDAITLAATALFSERGYAAVGVDEIARAVGMSGPALYRYFTTKQDILHSILDHGVDDLLAVLDIRCVEPDDTLAAMARAHLSRVLHNPQLTVVVLYDARSLDVTRRRRFLRRLDAYVNGWAVAMKRARPELSEAMAHAAALALLGALNAVHSWPAEVRTPDSFGLVADAALAGLSHSPRAESGPPG